MKRFRGFSLLEVIIALSITALGITLGYQVMGLITERLKRLNYEKSITHISKINKLYLRILKTAPKTKGKGIKKGNLLFRRCSNIEINNEHFKVCEYYRKHPYVEKYLPTGVYYAPELDLLFSR